MRVNGCAHCPVRESYSYKAIESEATRKYAVALGLDDSTMARYENGASVRSVICDATLAVTTPRTLERVSVHNDIRTSRVFKSKRDGGVPRGIVKVVNRHRNPATSENINIASQNIQHLRQNSNQGGNKVVPIPKNSYLVS